MNLKQIINKATDKSNFSNVQSFVEFCSQYLDYAASNLQAVIVAQNENHYHFFQYRQEGGFQITRPVNSRLMYDIQTFRRISKDFLQILKTAETVNRKDDGVREILNNATYTIQQSIGAALDGLPAGQSNTARKLNGDLFEHFIRLIIKETGVDCRAGAVKIPVMVNGEKAFDMNYQHDLIIENDGDIRLIGSIKTSSKDRLDKIFTDKFLYNKLTEKKTPHVAVFLNDVQRKNTAQESKYRISSTFLSGHFKGYTVKLSPLDGVYYCDIRPNMQTEDILKEHIKTFDKLIIDDIWKYK